jgi:SAM-dependent methyltransferase
MSTTGRAYQPHNTPTNTPTTLQLSPPLTVARQELVRTLIGETLLPAPQGLASYIGRFLDIRSSDRVLIVSPDPSASALILAREFGCAVVGVITNSGQLERARARVADLGRKVEIRAGSIERLPFRTQRFNVAISEGAFAASADKTQAASELYTALRERGRLALAEPTVYREMINDELVPLFSWLTPFSGARPAGVYRSLLAERGFTDFIVEDRRQDLAQAAEIARQKLMLVNLGAGDGADMPSEDVEASVRLSQSVLDLIDKGVASFAVITAEKG